MRQTLLLGAVVVVVAGGTVLTAGAGAASVEPATPFGRAAPAPPHGYKVQESIPVPYRSANGVRSRKPLLAGEVYVLRVTGTIFTGLGTGPGFGDAEYVFRPDNGHVIDACRNGVDLGVGIDDTNISPGHVKTPHWGRLSVTHLYAEHFSGTGARIRVDYHDCNYADNSSMVQHPGTGRLTLWIYAPI